MAKVVEESRRNLPHSDTGDANFFDNTIVHPKVLMPGCPDRVRIMASMWDEGAQVWPKERGFAVASGTYKGAPITAVSHGIGGGSMENPLMALFPHNPDAIIRVGSTGTLREDIHIGDLIINDANVRLDGTSNMYVRDEFPSAANFEVTMALVQACEELGYTYYVGTGCTTCSFFAGQGRPSYGGYEKHDRKGFFEDMNAAGIINFEMEGATLLTLSRLFGFRAGMIAAVVANRITGEWAEHSGEEHACRAGAEAIRILTSWDEAKKRSGKRFFYPALLKE